MGHIMTSIWRAQVTRPTEPWRFSGEYGALLNVDVALSPDYGSDWAVFWSGGETLTHVRFTEEGVRPASPQVRIPEEAARALYDALGYYFGGHSTPNQAALADALKVERGRVDLVLKKLLED
jgi:hypothetical protein